MSVGGRSAYCMTRPDSGTSRGWWRFLGVEPVRRIEVEDGFSREDGRPNEDMPSMRMVFTFEPTSTASRFTSVTHFTSPGSMEQLVKMGMVEGMKSALGQLDDLPAGNTSAAPGCTTVA